MPEQKPAQEPQAAGSSNPDGKPTSESTSGAGDDPKQQITLTPQQLKERLERAKPSDYDDLKAKAAEFDKLQEASKSELQKAIDRAEAAEKARDAAAVEAVRFKVASKFGLSDEDAELFLTGRDEESMVRVAEKLAARNEEAGKPRAPRPDPNQGKQSAGPASTADLFASAVSEAFK